MMSVTLISLIRNGQESLWNTLALCAHARMHYLTTDFRASWKYSEYTEFGAQS